MNITKIIPVLFLAIVIGTSVSLYNHMNNECRELDENIQVGLEYEKDKLRWQIEEITKYSHKNIQCTIERDSIVEIIDTTSLFINPFDIKTREKILSDLNRIDSCFNIVAKTGESNISFFTRAIKGYFNFTYKEYDGELAVKVSRIDSNDNNTLTIGLIPFKILNQPDMKIYYKDSLIATSSPFIWNGNPKGLKLKYTNSFTNQTQSFAY